MKKIYLHLASSMSVLALIAQGASALAEPSHPTVVSPERIVTAGADTPQAQTAPTAASMDPVTSVSELSDVQPTDWAFQALQSLIERYGCIAGYADGTFRSSHALTRYEFAAGMSTCLNKIIEQVGSLSPEDLATIQRLQDEFAAELATLRGRVNSLEAHTAELEANQFSTTTKLTGLVVAALSWGTFSGDRIIDATGAEITNKDPNPTILYRATLDFDTSFSGTDLLRARVEAGSDRAGDNAAGFLDPNFGSFLDFSYRSAIDDKFSVTQLSYTFTPFKDFTVTLAPAVDIVAFVDKNNYANPSSLNFSTYAFTSNYILFPLTPGASAVIDWNPGKGPFKVRALYLSGDAANPSSDNQGLLGPASPLATLLYPNGGGNRGLFGGPYQGIVELEYAPDKAFAVRLQYSGGKVFNGRFDVFGANFELVLSDQFAVFGRYGYGSYQDTAFGDINPNYWMAGVEFRDLFVPNALAGIAAGQPFIEAAVGNATQTNVEAFYNFPISDNIRITPLIQVIADPGNQKSNGTIVTGTLRTVFSF